MSVKRYEPVAWMRKSVTFRGLSGSGRLPGERITSESKVYDDDVPLYSAETVAALEAEVAGLRKQVTALKLAGKRAIGDHYSPDDCYATGPLTGNAIIDLVECPACSFLSLCDSVDTANAALTQPEPDDE